MTISPEMVKDLRHKTGAGILDCKKALEENQGDFEKSIDWLRKKGIAKAEKKSDRSATEGLIVSYIHGGGRIGVLVEVNSETDFVARNDEFKDFVRDIAMHIAAINPLCVSSDQIPDDVKQREKSIYLAKAREEGKKEEMIERIVDGQIKKWIDSQCLLTQPYIKDPNLTVETYLKNTIAKIGENLIIRRFVRYELGQGIEKKQSNFAEEVAAQLKG